MKLCSMFRANGTRDFFFFHFNRFRVFEWVIFVEHICSVSGPYLSPTVRTDMIDCGRRGRRVCSEREREREIEIER